MDLGMFHDYQAQCQERYRQEVLFPAIERQAVFLRELELERARLRARHPRPARWLGARLVRMGEWLSGTAASPAPEV